MGKRSPSPPPAPDPGQTAQAQAAANKEAVRESALVNQINQVTPYGSVNYTGEIGSPNRTQTVSLPPELQKALEGQQRITGGLTDFAEQYVPRVAGGLETPFNTADVGVNRPQVNDNTYNTVADALMGRLEPRFERDEDQLRTRLANQGIGQGSEAFTNAMTDFGQVRNDARLAALGQAGQEASRQYGLESNAYQQAISDALLNRTQGLNEVSALLQGAPAIQSPGAPNPAQYQVAPPDVMGAQNMAYQGSLNQYNQQQANNRSMMGGLAGLGAAGITLLSDRRAKTDIRRVGVMDNGIPVYTYRYRSGGPVMMGVMADEVEKIVPEAVVEFGDFKHVNYGAL